MTEPLKPCPFCNSPASFHDGEDEDGQFVAVQCDGCGCGSGKHYPIMDDARPNAADEWNQRYGGNRPDVERRHPCPGRDYSSR